MLLQPAPQGFLLGEKEIAALAISNQIYFLMILLFFGIASGTSVFTAQYWGKGDALAPYLDADGALYVRYSPGAKTDAYQEIMPPTISVSGRVQK